MQFLLGETVCGSSIVSIVNSEKTLNTIQRSELTNKRLFYDFRILIFFYLFFVCIFLNFEPCVTYLD